MLNNLLTIGGNTVATMDTIRTSMTTAFTTAKGDMLGMISDVTPIAIAVVGAGLAVTFGIKFFKKISGKA